MDDFYVYQMIISWLQRRGPDLSVVKTDDNLTLDVNIFDSLRRNFMDLCQSFDALMCKTFGAEQSDRKRNVLIIPLANLKLDT